MSHTKIQAFLNDWLNVYLSKGVIGKSLREAGRAVAPLESEIISDIQEAVLAHADETSWKQQGEKLWLWVFTATTACLFLIGSRGKAIAEQILNGCTGHLMSDGYGVYRQYLNRLRCWAHLIRKLKGLSESLDGSAAHFGNVGLELFDILQKAVYAAREGPQKDISEKFAEILAAFKLCCEQHAKSEHEKTKKLAREFLNDWEAIWLVLSNVDFPMTNNEAERLLRHWVINRQISFGTRSKEGSRAFSLLASVIETCRLRKVSPWPYLAQVIADRRANKPAPPLPVAEAI